MSCYAPIAEFRFKLINQNPDFASQIREMDDQVPSVWGLYKYKLHTNSFSLRTSNAEQVTNQSLHNEYEHTTLGSINVDNFCNSFGHPHFHSSVNSKVSYFPPILFSFHFPSLFKKCCHHPVRSFEFGLVATRTLVGLC